MGDETTTVSKPFPGFDFDTFDGCVAAISDEEGIDDPEAFCAWLEQEGKDALEDPNADEVLTDLTVEYVSAVDVPAQDSQWVIAKHAEGPKGDTHRWNTTGPLLISKTSDADAETKDSDEKQIAYAPVLLPGEADKQGDVIPSHEIEAAAHKYLAHYRKVDSDHDLLDGKGIPVESWVAKSPTTFEFPDGTESREYAKGTWFMGIRFDDETWERVKSGDLTGLSIYGGARPLDVDTLIGGGSTDRAATALSKDDTESMSDNDESEPTVKQDADAGTVSTMLAEFRAYLDDHGGEPGSVTFEEFVKWILESGAVEESEISGLDVFLGGTGGGDEPDAGGSEDEAPDGEQDDGLEMSNKSESDGESDADADTEPADGDADGGDPLDDAPEWAKSLSKDIRGSVDDVRKDVDDLRGRVDDLEAEVKDEPDGERMESDDGKSERMKSASVDDAVDERLRELFDVDDDVDDDVIRKAFAEQIAKADGDDLRVDYEGISEGEDADSTASTGRSASANKRMVGMGGGD